MSERKKKRYRYTEARKYMGDDRYSWAVFEKGCVNPIITGLSRFEVDYYRDRFEREIAEFKDRKV